MREPIPVARELLLVQGNTAAQPDSREEPVPAELIWTLAELRAERVLLPPSWPTADTTDADASDTASGLASRLDQEYELIDENIAALFEAIRIGSIEPKDADRFVEQLRQLVANSRVRIQDGLRQKAGASSASVEELIGAFGGERVGRNLSDLGVSLPGYPSAVAVALPPRGDDGVSEFRRLPYSSLSRYIFLENRLAARLSAMEERGYFDETDPRARPSIMRDHIRSLRRELYEHPTETRAAVWRDAVDEYFEAIAGLIDDDTQARLIERLGTLEETGNLEDESAAHIREMKQELRSTFATLRDEYAAVTALRNELAEAVGGSFVILDDGAAGEDSRAEDAAVPARKLLTQGERRAVIANSALAGEHLVAPIGWKRTLLLTAAGLIIGIILAPFRLVVAAALSPAALLLVAALFPALFFAADIWVDPLSVAAVLVGAIFASTAAAGLSQWSVERTLPGKQTGRRRTAVVVVAPENGRKADELEAFHRAISRKIRQLGGVVVGEEGSTVFAAFDAPPAERATRGKPQQADDARLAQSACAAAKELVSATLPAGITIRCGVEVGELLFYLSPIGGYRATGRPITYARRLCDLTEKLRCRALFGDSVVSACRDKGDARRFQEKGKLVVRAGSERYSFFSFTEIDPPSP